MIFGRIGFFDDFLTGPRSAKNFRSRIFDGREMAEKSIFPVGDHFPRPYDANFFKAGKWAKNLFFRWGTTFRGSYDANFLRPGNGRKIDFSGGGPLFWVLTMLIF